MAILTKFLQLLKPEKNDYVDVEKHLSENYDKIDTKLEELSNSNDEKLDKGNVPNVLNSAETIFKALQANTGIKFDESLLYLNDSGTKKKGYCYIDKLTDGIFECIQETTTTVNNATYFKNFSNKENSDRLSNLSGYRLLCEGTFDENNINQELEVFDYSKLSDTKKITALEIICIGSETRNHIASSVTKYAFLTLDGDHVPAKIFDIKTTLCNLNFKFNISVDARKRKIIVSCAKSGYKYSIYSIEHTMNIL